MKMKIKCVKLQCPVCGETGSCQIFFNKQNEIKYGRVRHYTGLNESKKPQFSYCKLDDIEQLETSLNSLNFQYPKPKSIGHKTTKDSHDHTSVSLLSGQPNSSLKLKVVGPLVSVPKWGRNLSQLAAWKLSAVEFLGFNAKKSLAKL
jgi:hypothetical protein